MGFSHVGGKFCKWELAVYTETEARDITLNPTCLKHFRWLVFYERHNFPHLQVSFEELHMCNQRV